MASSSLDIGNITISAGRTLPGLDYAQGPVGVRITMDSVVFFNRETDDHILVVARSDLNVIHALAAVPGLPRVAG